LKKIWEVYSNTFKRWKAFPYFLDTVLKNVKIENPVAGWKKLNGKINLESKTNFLKFRFNFLSEKHFKNQQKPC